MLRGSVAHAVVRVPELNGVVVATGSEDDATLVHGNPYYVSVEIVSNPVNPVPSPVVGLVPSQLNSLRTGLQH